MVYDCFTFFNELDLLEIRLNVLNDVVDKFVLVEMNKTHTGADKPFVFEQNKKRFAKFLPKIIHIKVDDYPDLKGSNADFYGNKWLLENYQRDKIMDGLKNAKDEDVVIISDLDEIPDPNVIKSYDKSGIWVLDQKMFYYFVNMLCKNSPIWPNGTRVGRYHDLKNPNQELEKCEFYEFSKFGMPTYFRFCRGKRILNAGWHFSYCGGVQAIINKRKAIVEQQFNTTENMSEEYILNKIKKGEDIFGREYSYVAIPLDKSFPKYIIDNQEKYSDLIFKCTILDKYRYTLLSFKRFVYRFLSKILLNRKLRHYFHHKI